VRLVLALGALVALGPLTIDTYLPALPAIATDLNATSAAVQLTLTGTLIGMAGGQLLIGPLSDAWGRRPLLVAGIAVHVLAGHIARDEGVEIAMRAMRAELALQTDAVRARLS